MGERNAPHDNKDGRASMCHGVKALWLQAGRCLAQGLSYTKLNQSLPSVAVYFPKKFLLLP